MTAGKIRTILVQVDRKVPLDHGARLAIEIGRPGEAVQVYDVADAIITDDAAILAACVRAAICKSRHRAKQATPCGSTPRASSRC